MLVSVFVVLMMTASALGGGLFVMRLVKPSDDVCPLVRLASAFVLGIGILGWLGFFFALLGFLSPILLVVLLGVPMLGLLCWDAKASLAIKALRQDETSRALVVILALVLFLNLLEGLAPPIDADSLAYHFALPKLFLREGHLVFVPRAQTGAIPLLQQMTYMIALGTGGEPAMTLWTTVSGWGTSALLFALCRNYVAGRWALLVALLFATTPAVVYGSGSGQVEVRNAAFVLAAVFWALEAAKSRHVGNAVLAGLAIGFFVGSKYPGLLSLAALGVALIVRSRELRVVAAFSAAALVAGSQWYFWNWWNIGDPLFPALYGIIDYPAGAPWNAGIHAFWRQYMAAAEKVLPSNVLWLFAYPFLATLKPYPVFESLRAGFGPYVLLLLPLALAGWWGHRKGWHRSDLLFFGAVCFAAYALWFLLGPSQRLRHLLPLYPLLMIVVSVAAVRAVESWPGLKTGLLAAMALTLLIQVGGQGLFSLKYARRVATGENRSAFLEQQIPGFDAVRWINETLTDDDYLMTGIPHILYLFDIPAFPLVPMVEAEVEDRPGVDPSTRWRQVRKLGLTHLLLSSDSAPDAAARSFLPAGCLAPMRTFEVRAMASRTLPTLRSTTEWWTVYRITPETCDRPPQKGKAD